MSRAPRLVAGVDGCPAGWVAAIGEADGRCPPGGPVWLAVAGSLAELIDAHPRVARWAVDMPLGLASDGPRPADAEARRRLGPRRSSVFPAIPLPALDAVEYSEACRLAEAATGKRISKQAWNLAPKIRELRALALNAPSRRRRAVFECHPELAFAAIGSGVPCPHPKKSDAGHEERVALLASVFGPEPVSRFIAQAETTRGVGVDDALDAAACWFSASRDLADATESVGDDRITGKPRFDATGLPLEIRW
ncbi:MAG: DUF429 domain-containing protein [Planctomycetota bacterium]